ncbi:hypothetical protein RF11_15012 [Thelohanellus kitauei]|uniref:Uncharacterized protein n=1 Tax=Thelohanellus kitauei TaxID=669202 RepID=A0A0C2IEQ2_THEKT|nr:hypothetical protein RF11_15012 [Thelohanellus kitauei]
MLTQASFSISVTLAIITVILAVMVQIFKRWKALTGYFAAVTRRIGNKSFISELHSAAPVIQENGHLLDSYLLICIWPITLIFVFLAAYVLWQRFFKERNIIITLEERVPLNEY